MQTNVLELRGMGRRMWAPGFQRWTQIPWVVLQYWVFVDQSGLCCRVGQDGAKFLYPGDQGTGPCRGSLEPPLPQCREVQHGKSIGTLC